MSSPLTPIQESVCEAIQDKGGKARPSELAETFGVSPETAGRHCRALESLGLLTAHRCGGSEVTYKISGSGWLLHHAPRSQWRGVPPRGMAPAGTWAASDVGTRQAQALAVLAALGGRDVGAGIFARYYYPRDEFAKTMVDLDRFQHQGLVVLASSAEGISVTMTTHGVRLAEVLGFRVKE